MSAEPRILKTEAEQMLAEQFRTHRHSLPGGPAIATVREEAFAAFERAGLPHRRVEAWKYTDLRALMKRAETIAPAPSAEAAARMHAALPSFGTLDRYRLVIADGFFQESLSDRGALLAEGIEVATLGEFLGFDGDTVAEVLEAPAGADDDAMIALNAAMASDGVVIFAGEGAAPTKPIEIVHLTTGGEPAAWFARSLAKFGKGARATLLVSHVGPDGVASQSNSFVRVHADDTADITVVDLQRGGDAAQHIATFDAVIGTGTRLQHLAVTAGSALSRLQGFAAIKGEGSELGIFGANMLAGSEHGDVSWRIDHAVPGASSRVLYKNASADTAFGAFQGLILVRPDAQKTDGKMMTRALLLSEEAQFTAKPELEIYADDVQCGHGATIGQIDGEGLFYLMSRGIPRTEAEALLVRAFLQEAIDAIDNESVAEALDPIVDGWLERRSR